MRFFIHLSELKIIFMEMLYLLPGIIIGGIVVYFARQSAINILKNNHISDINILEKEWYQKLAEADKERSLSLQRAGSLEEELKQQQSKLQEERLKSEDLTRNLATSQSELQNLRERLENQAKELEQIQKRFTVEFENIAHKILKENSIEFTSTNQKNIGEILLPLKEKILNFEKKVEETYEKGLKDQTDLKAELKKLQELNLRISTEAQNLTHALKGDVKKQGNWGEIVLERVLERSGLVRGREFEREVVDENSDGKQIRPDVIVHLPDKKHIIIDSKVSLIAYERLVNSTNDEERSQFVAEHLRSLRSHIKGLSEKHYSSARGLNSPDFVLLFVPIESSFSLAVQEDQELFNYAWDNKVVIVSPSTLLASLRTIASIWKQENQTRNAIEIANLGSSLYDKFVNFILDIEKLGKGLDTAKGSYENALNKLHTGRGNLVKTAEKLRDLGIKTQKAIPDYLITEESAKALPE
jgi:DNA recombination protein RmuC